MLVKVGFHWGNLLATCKIVAAFFRMREVLLWVASVESHLNVRWRISSSLIYSSSDIAVMVMILLVRLVKKNVFSDCKDREKWSACPTLVLHIHHVRCNIARGGSYRPPIRLPPVFCLFSATSALQTCRKHFFFDLLVGFPFSYQNVGEKLGQFTKAVSENIL